MSGYVNEAHQHHRQQQQQQQRPNLIMSSAPPITAANGWNPQRKRLESSLITCLYSTNKTESQPPQQQSTQHHNNYPQNAHTQHHHHNNTYPHHQNCSRNSKSSLLSSPIEPFNRPQDIIARRCCIMPPAKLLKKKQDHSMNEKHSDIRDDFNQRQQQQQQYPILKWSSSSAAAATNPSFSPSPKIPSAAAAAAAADGVRTTTTEFSTFVTRRRKLRRTSQNQTQPLDMTINTAPINAALVERYSPCPSASSSSSSSHYSPSEEEEEKSVDIENIKQTQSITADLTLEAPRTSVSFSTDGAAAARDMNNSKSTTVLTTGAAASSTNNSTFERLKTPMSSNSCLLSSTNDNSNSSTILMNRDPNLFTTTRQPDHRRNLSLSLKPSQSTRMILKLRSGASRRSVLIEILMKLYVLAVIAFNGWVFWMFLELALRFRSLFRHKFHALMVGAIIASCKPVINIMVFLLFGFRVGIHKRLLRRMAEVQSKFSDAFGYSKLTFRKANVLMISMVVITFSTIFALRLSMYIEMKEQPGRLSNDLSLLSAPLLSVWNVIPLIYFHQIHLLIRHWGRQLSRSIRENYKVPKRLGDVGGGNHHHSRHHHNPQQNYGNSQQQQQRSGGGMNNRKRGSIGGKYSMKFYYQRFCQLTELQMAASEFFNPYIAFSFLWSMFTLCLTIYFVINAEESHQPPMKLDPEGTRLWNKVINYNFGWIGIQIFLGLAHMLSICDTGRRTNEEIGTIIISYAMILLRFRGTFGEGKGNGMDETDPTVGGSSASTLPATPLPTVPSAMPPTRTPLMFTTIASLLAPSQSNTQHNLSAFVDSGRDELTNGLSAVSQFASSLIHGDTMYTVKDLPIFRDRQWRQVWTFRIYFSNTSSAEKK